MKEKMIVSSGLLYKANKDVICNPYPLEKGLKRRVIIDAGEIVEFRYFSPCNVRTIDNLHLVIEENLFRDGFDIYAEILPSIVSRNNNTLKQIIECGLYDHYN